MDYYTYHFIVNGRVVHSGITSDPNRQQLDDQARWSQGQIQIVGGPMSEKAAMDWKRKAGSDARTTRSARQGPGSMGDKALAIDITHADGIVTVNLSGRMDGRSAQTFHRETERLHYGPSGGVLLDMTDLAFISSAGLRVTLILAKQLSAKRCPMAMYGLSEMVREVYAVSGFDQVLNIVESREAAVNMVAETPGHSAGPIE